MRGLKILVSTAALLAGLAIAPAARAQISISIGVQPTCSFGYYGYAPYGCAPRGYYGSGYFYNGVFVGMGPWSGYGYSHGWGGHRFVSDGGGRYHGGVGHVTYHENQGNKGSHKSYPQHVVVMTSRTLATREITAATTSLTTTTTITNPRR